MASSTNESGFCICPGAPSFEERTKSSTTSTIAIMTSNQKPISPWNFIMEETELLTESPKRLDKSPDTSANVDMASLIFDLIIAWHNKRPPALKIKASPGMIASVFVNCPLFIAKPCITAEAINNTSGITKITSTIKIIYVFIPEKKSLPK